MQLLMQHHHSCCLAWAAFMLLDLVRVLIGLKFQNHWLQSVHLSTLTSYSLDILIAIHFVQDATKKSTQIDSPTFFNKDFCQKSRRHRDFPDEGLILFKSDASEAY